MMPKNNLGNMLDKGMQEISKKMDLDQNEVLKLKMQLPGNVFVTLKDKALSDEYKNHEVLPQEEREKISLLVVKERLTAKQYEAAHNVCSILQSVATISGDSDLSHALSLTSAGARLAEQSNILISSIKNGAGALISPAAAILTIGFELFSLFDDRQEQSIENIILEQLQAISKQVKDMHEQMLTGHKEIHKHLLLIHESIDECANNLKALLSDEIKDFRADVVSRLKDFSANLEKIYEEIKEGQQDILLQDLENLIVKVKDRIDDKYSSDPREVISDTASHLLTKWLLRNAANKSLNGARAYIAGNTSTAHQKDILLFKKFEKNFSGILGYLASMAIDMGMSMEMPEKGPTIKSDNILNSEVFRLALKQYMSLYEKFPAYLNDQGASLREIVSMAENTYNFVERVSMSQTLFDNLIKNYQAALHNVDKAVANQNVSANTILRHDYKVSECFDLNDSMPKMFAKAQELLPQNQVVKAQFPLDLKGIGCSENVILPDVKLEHLAAYKDFKLTGADILGELFNLCTMNFTYNLDSISFCCGDNGPVHVYYRVENGKVLKEEEKPPVSTYGAKIKYNFKLTFKINSHPNEHSYVFNVFTGYRSGDQRQQICELFFDKPNEPGFFERACRVLQSRTFFGFFDGKNPIANMQKNINQILQLSKLDGTPRQSDHYSCLIQSAIMRKICEFRTNMVADKLLNEPKPDFVRALNHLDSAKLRLKAFASLAGFSAETIDLIDKLVDSHKVKADITAYRDSNIDDKVRKVNRDTEGSVHRYWQSPTAVEIDNLKNICRSRVSTFNMHIDIFGLKLIMEYLKAYPSKPKIEQRDYVLAVDLKSLEVHAHTSESMQKYALAKAIMRNDIDDVVIVLNHLDDNKLIKAPLNTAMVSALHLAAYLGNKAIIERLIIKLGPDLLSNVIDLQTTSDNNRETALIYAVRSTKLSVVKLLLDNGADFSIKNKQQKDALAIALELNLPTIAEEITKRKNATKNEVRFSFRA